MHRSVTLYVYNKRHLNTNITKEAIFILLNFCYSSPWSHVTKPNVLLKLNLLVTFVPDIASQDEVKYKSTFVRKYLPTCLLT